MALGFVVGVAVTSGALLWLRIEENVTRDRDAARVEELDAQVQKLEQTVTRLSDLVSASRQIATQPAASSQGVTAWSADAPTREMPRSEGEHSTTIAATGSMVDRALPVKPPRR